MTKRLRHMAFAIVSHTLTLYQLNYSQTPSLSKWQAMLLTVNPTSHPRLIREASALTRRDKFQ